MAKTLTPEAQKASEALVETSARVQTKLRENPITASLADQPGIVELIATLKVINNMCNAPHWHSNRRWVIEHYSRSALLGWDI